MSDEKMEIKICEEKTVPCSHLKKALNTLPFLIFENEDVNDYNEFLIQYANFMGIIPATKKFIWEDPPSFPGKSLSNYIKEGRGD